eukprot:5200003-Pleurochrysis_carterae.AAC.1
MSRWSSKRSFDLVLHHGLLDGSQTSKLGTSSALVNSTTAPPAATTRALPLPLGTMGLTPFSAVMTITLGSRVTPNGNQRLSLSMCWSHLESIYSTTCPTSCAKPGEVAGRRAAAALVCRKSHTYATSLSRRSHSYSPTYLQYLDTHPVCDKVRAFIPFSFTRLIHWRTEKLLIVCLLYPCLVTVRVFWIAPPRTTHTDPARTTALLPAGAAQPPVGPNA